MTTQKLQGKVAVITGGNSGIGLATAHLFAREGAQVVIFGRNQESLDAALTSLEGRAIGVRGDVSRLEDLDRLYATVVTVQAPSARPFQAVYLPTVVGEGVASCSGSFDGA